MAARTHQYVNTGDAAPSSNKMSIWLLAQDASKARDVSEKVSPRFQIDAHSQVDALISRLEQGAVPDVLVVLIGDDLKTLDMCRELRARAGASVLPILTIGEKEHMACAALRAGMSDHLTLPIDEDELALRIESLATRRAIELQLYRAQTRARALLDELDSYQRKHQDAVDLATRERARAEAANRAKDEFLATMSHELRTPLNAMLGWVQMLRTGKLDPEAQSKALETIERNARAQSQIIEDLLDVSRIITGKMRLSVERVSLSAVVREAVEAVKVAAQVKGVRLVTAIDDKLSPLLGDPHRLMQVAWNLLSNAVKFTPNGGAIHIAVQRHGEQIEFHVRDNGRGINPAFVPHVFERFRQADNSTTRELGGLGLGLAIVRNLVELHGGIIHAESKGEGHGACFTVRLPSHEQHSALDATEGIADEEKPPGLSTTAALSGLDILLVDDEQDSRDLLRAMLESCQATVRCASSVEEALALFDMRAPQLVLSDIAMPGEDGLSLLQRIRASQDPARATTPAIAISAYTRNEDRNRARLAGFDAHLPKPVEPADLIALVLRIVRRTEAREEKQRFDV